MTCNYLGVVTVPEKLRTRTICLVEGKSHDAVNTCITEETANIYIYSRCYTRPRPEILAINPAIN